RADGEGDAVPQGERTRHRRAAIRCRRAAAAGLCQARCLRVLARRICQRFCRCGAVAPVTSFYPHATTQGFQRLTRAPMILAVSGYEPTVTVGVTLRADGVEWVGAACAGRSARQLWLPCSARRPRPAFNGFRSGNLTRQAEASVLSGRETLRNAEQTALLDAATAYMNVLRDTAILDLQRRNVQVLQEQLKQARDRFNVGEVTRTDI